MVPERGEATRQRLKKYLTGGLQLPNNNTIAAISIVTPMAGTTIHKVSFLRSK